MRSVRLDGHRTADVVVSRFDLGVGEAKGLEQAPVEIKVLSGLESKPLQTFFSKRIDIEHESDLEGRTDCRIEFSDLFGNKTLFAVEGGWYAVLRVPALASDEELAIGLLEQTGVLVQPGHFFDFGSNGYQVMSLITKPEIFREGVRRVLGT